jgi:hypothetical protein
MKKLLLACGALALLGAPAAQATVANYNVTTTWFEPDTQPRDSIFVGSFTFDDVSHTITNLQGRLSESMTGDLLAYPNDNMTWLTLSNQLVSWHDAALGGTFAATFLKNTTATFSTFFGGDGWSPQSGVLNQGLYSGFPSAYATSIQNAYALIFVPDNPLTALTQGQIDKLAYADCAPGGMMGPTCMTGTSLAGYGSVGTMSGYPVSQTITAAVPEPETYAMMMAGLGLVGFMSRRRKVQAKALAA